MIKNGDCLQHQLVQGKSRGKAKMENNQMKEFNLLSEPWILALDSKGVQKKVSLSEILRDAHQYKRLTGELPTQDIAILRVLLAVLYGAFTKIDTDGKPITIDHVNAALRQWTSLWSKGSFPITLIEKYLDDYVDRFDLFHPEKPFFQVAGIRTTDGKANPMTQIIADIPSRIERRFFSNRLGGESDRLAFDEAVRWLINLQAWDYAGKKNAVVGGSPNGGGTGWLGKLGVVYLTGKNLFETLMLNFVLVNDNALIEFGAPTWEQEIKTAEKRELQPKGYADLLTWQSRRVLLFAEDDAVTGVLASYGDVFDKEGVFDEQMTGWHVSAESKERDRYIPNTLNKERSIWRDLNALLPLDAPNKKVRVPGVVLWRRFLKRKGAIDAGTVRISTVGLDYGAMMGVVTEMITDEIAFSADLLTSLGQDWIPRILSVLETTERCVGLLAILARDLAKSAGSDSKDTKLMEAASRRARATAYEALDRPFRDWLAAIEPASDDKDEVSERWNEFMRDLILRIGKSLIEKLNDRTFVGRDVAANAPTASLKFKGSMYKTVPLKKERRS
jgi:CRISPR system Cascade subunit CasA